MDRHVRNLSTFSIVFGLFAALGSLLILLLFGGFSSVYQIGEDAGSGFIAVLVVLMHLVVGVPCVVTGYFIRRYVPWARQAMTVLCALNLLNPPVGSILGVYGLWVLMTPETDPLFFDPPRKTHARVSRHPVRGRSTIRAERAAPPHIKAAEPDLPE